MVWFKKTSHRFQTGWQLALTVMVAGSLLLGTSAGAATAVQTTTQTRTTLSMERPASPTVKSPHTDRVLTLADRRAKKVTSKAGPYEASLTLPGSLTTAKALPNSFPNGLPNSAVNARFAGRGEPVLSTEIPASNSNAGTVISSYATGEGTQTLLTIGSAQAPTSYSFPLSLPSGTTATVNTIGGIDITDSAGKLIGGYHTPWAQDAHGTPVPTRFTLTGNPNAGYTLTQTIDHHQNLAYPVTADPNDFWSWTVCIAAITGTIAGNMAWISKITKLGGIAKFAKMLLEAKNAEERWLALRNVFGEFVGIKAIMDNCK